VCFRVRECECECERVSPCVPVCGRCVGADCVGRAVYTLHLPCSSSRMQPLPLRFSVCTCACP
jgi:hypothetical protein